MISKPKPKLSDVIWAKFSSKENAMFLRQKGVTDPIMLNSQKPRVTATEAVHSAFTVNY